MDLLKNQLARLQQQLALLSASQRMLTGTLIAIMLMTLVWWGKYAGQSEMEPVLDQDFSPEEIARVTADIASRDIKYSVTGTRVLVPSDRKYEVLAALSFEGLLPHDTQAGIEEMVHKMSTPWDSQGQQEDLRNKAKGMTLSQVLRNFPHVQNAVVLIDPTSRRGIGEGGNVFPTASVNLEMKPGQKADRKLVNAAADLVAGAVSNLSRSHVNVIVDGATWKIHEADDSDGGGESDGYIARVQEGERHFARKIQEQLSFIDGLAVSVTVQPSDRSVQGEQTTIDAKNTVQMELHTDNTTETTSTPGGGGGKDPGAIANVGINTASSSTPSDNATTDKEATKSDYTILPSQTHISYHLFDNVQVVSASVRVPRSYFVRILKQAKPDREPDDAMIDQLIDHELPKIRNDVKACTYLKSDDMVVVDTYTDLMPANTTAAPTAASAVTVALGSHGKEIALGALAVVSLLMVSMMVKKGAAPNVLVEPGETVSSAMGTTAAAAATAKPAAKASKPARTPEDLEEVAEGTSALDGIELDPEAVRSKQMLEQVTSMVKENPDAAANLVKRWLNRS